MKINLCWLRHGAVRVFFCLLWFCSCSGPAGNGGEPFRDLSHDSKVFGHKKSYRLYLPEGYEKSSRRYPVIYFFHGWGGRNFQDGNAKLDYPLLKPLADKYGVILVMWDGNIDPSEPNPYNIGYHDDVKFQVQMKDYFPELVGHIDSFYRTLTDRGHRGIIGFSMGGFMSLYLAGKYPDSVCAAVSLEGSPEFFVGWPGNQTLYPIRYTFSNLPDQAVYIRNGKTDILYYLNEEVHAGAIWEGKQLEYETFPGGHVIDSSGQTRIFEKAMRFVADAFKKEWSAPDNWSHTDLYPDFSVWGWQVHSNKREPGYLFLKNAGTHGFGLFTHRWLPDGPPIGLAVRVTTAPVYTLGKLYGVAKLAVDSGKVSLIQARSDAQGRIGVDVDGAGAQVGIFDADSGPEFVVSGYSLNGKGGFLHIGKGNRMAVRLFNRGGEKAPHLFQIGLVSSDSSIKINDPVRIIKVIAGHRLQDLTPFEISCYKKPPLHAEPPDIKFTLTVRMEGDDNTFATDHRGSGLSGSDSGKIFRDQFDVPVWYEASFFDSIRIDDGRAIRDSAYGKGNADGVADAGESILVYQGSHRLRLYTQDPWVLEKNERLADEVIPARWPDGYTFSSVIQLSPDCPDAHTLEFLASYETKTFNPIERSVHWGRVRLTVRGKHR